MNEPLAPDYYLQNFRFLINWVNERYADLLGQDEQQFIARFDALDHSSQCLLVRLVSRKGPWFRADKLSYAEIPDIKNAANTLIAAGLLQINPNINVATCANLLTKPELLALFPTELQPYKQERKDLLSEILCEFFPAEKSWDDWTRNQYGALYHIDLGVIIETFLLLFFGNPYQNLSEFVLQDLGLLRYESYVIDNAHRLFSNREEILHYQILLNLREHLALAGDAEALQRIAQQLPEPLASLKMKRRHARLCNQLAYQLERLNEHSLALELYSQHALPPARERRIRLLEKRGEFSQAWMLLNELLSDPMDEQEKQIAERMAPRLAKKAGEKFARTTHVSVKEVQLQLPKAGDEPCDVMCVEERVRQYYQRETAPCFYVENQLFNGLLGLWLWPELYRSVEGAFANPFQVAPLDMYQEDFQVRRPGMSRLWTQLDAEEHKENVRTMWTAKYGIVNPLVTWQALDEELLNLALHCIPAAHLKKIFERLLFDLRNNRSGFPDLIQFFPDDASYRLIEVKGPGDRIQDNQHRWLAFFSQQGIPAEVCYVSWQPE